MRASWSLERTAMTRSGATTRCRGCSATSRSARPRNSVDDPPTSSPGPRWRWPGRATSDTALDGRARQEYRVRLGELREELEAERLADLGRGERARAELDMITGEFGRAYGRAGGAPAGRSSRTRPCYGHHAHPRLPGQIENNTRPSASICRARSRPAQFAPTSLRPRSAGLYEVP